MLREFQGINNTVICAYSK